VPLATDPELRDLLQRVRTIAVVGIKGGRADDAYRVPRYLQAHGYRILPVSPKLDHVLGERCVPTLLDLAETPDLVDLFRAPEHVPAHAQEVLALPRAPLGVWMQLGVRHAEAAARLEAAGIAVVEDRCLLVEHRRLLGGRAEAEPRGDGA
jgi:predicted CoA-binding protein